mgnify:FL=1
MNVNKIGKVLDEEVGGKYEKEETNMRNPSEKK